MMGTEAKPFVKWAGGKRQLINSLFDNIPTSFSNYYEPFVGGGALFFKLWSEGLVDRAYLNDSNPDLIGAYNVIKQNPLELINELKSRKYVNDSRIYYQIREFKPENEIEKAARFLYLNRTAFNGLYRVNSQGKFNVPFGKYIHPKICDEENILLVSEALQKATITLGDFSVAAKKARKGDFAYFDPPYHPLSKTSSFTSYTDNNFTEKDQRRLSALFSKLDDRGVYVMLSNSYSPLIIDLYSNYSPTKVMARRNINCKADKRGAVAEIIAFNY